MNARLSRALLTLCVVTSLAGCHKPPERLYSDLLFDTQCAEFIPEFPSLDFGPGDNPRVFKAGWGEWECDEDQEHCFRWAQAKSANMALAFIPRPGLLLGFSVAPLVWNGAPSLNLSAFLNGRKLAQWELEGPATLETPLPEDAMIPGENLIEFRFSRVARPRDVIPGSQDDRTLAAAFSSLSIRSSGRPNRRDTHEKAGLLFPARDPLGAILIRGFTGVEFSADVPMNDPYLEFTLSSLGRYPQPARVWISAGDSGTSEVSEIPCSAGVSPKAYSGRVSLERWAGQSIKIGFAQDLRRPPDLSSIPAFKWTEEPLTDRCIELLAPGFRVPIGSARCSFYLERGWGSAEHSDSKGTFCWAIGTTAEIRVPLAPAGDTLLKARCWPFSWPGAQPQRVKLTVNGHEISQRVVPENGGVVRFNIPARFLVTGYNLLRFAFSRATRPSSVRDGSRDTRPLAVAFNEILLRPADDLSGKQQKDAADFRIGEFTSAEGIPLNRGEVLQLTFQVPQSPSRFAAELFARGHNTVALEYQLVNSEGVLVRKDTLVVRSKSSERLEIPLTGVEGENVRLLIAPIPSSREPLDYDERGCVDLVSELQSAKTLKASATVEFTAAEMGATLVAGWAMPEYTGEIGETFAWAIERRAEVSVPLVPVGTERLSFRVWPLSWPGWTGQEVEVSINGNEVANLELREGPQIVDVAIPPGVLVPGDNRVAFAFSSVTAPHDVMADSSDTRPLAAAFAWLHIGQEYLASTCTRPPMVGRPLSSSTPWGRAFGAGEAIEYSFFVPEDATGLALDTGLLGTRGGTLRLWLRDPSGRVAPDLFTSFVKSGGTIRFDIEKWRGKRVEVVQAFSAPQNEHGGKPRLVVANQTILCRKPKESVVVIRNPIVQLVERPSRGVALQRVRLLNNPPVPSSKPNVILIDIDTMRADMLSSYGGNAFTPNLDTLSRQGVVFRNAWSHTPITGPSHATIFTSLLPRAHGVLNNTDRLRKRFTTLAEVLRSAGYRTGAVVSLGVLKKKFGFAQGFEYYDSTFPTDWWKDAHQVTLAAEHLIRRMEGRPFFLWVHYSDPHEPYAPPSLRYPEIEIHAGDRGSCRLPADGRCHSCSIPLESGETVFTVSLREPGGNFPIILEPVFSEPNDVVFEFGRGWRKVEGEAVLPAVAAGEGPSAILRATNLAERSVWTKVTLVAEEYLPATEARNRYRAEVEFLDQEIGHLLELLQARGLFERTLIVLLGDHGESLGEHGHVGHISGLYRQDLHVPLVFVIPGHEQRETSVDEFVGLVDVMPTILDLVKVEPPDGLQGGGLFRSSKSGSQSAIVLETFPPEAPSHKVGLVYSGYHLILTTEDPTSVELYDLNEDLAEVRNLAPVREGVKNELQLVLERLLAQSGSLGGIEKSVGGLTEEERARLRSLGYLH